MDAHSELFQSLADPTRLRLLNLVMQTGEVCVCELVDALRLPQYTVSRHLQILRMAGLLDDRREGKWIYYRIARELKPYHRPLLRAVGLLRGERDDFVEDEKRAGRRLRLRRGGACCVGLVSEIASANRRDPQRPRKVDAIYARRPGVSIATLPAGEGRQGG